MTFSRGSYGLVALIFVALALCMVSSCSSETVIQTPMDESTLSPQELVFQYVSMGEASKLDSLLKSNPDLVNIYDDTYYNTPLHVAAINDNWKIVDILLENGANPNIENIDGKIPAESALQEAHVKMSTYLKDAAAKAQ